MQQYIDKILQATEYSGSLEPHTQAISASQIASDPQEVLMRYKHGVIKQDTIGQNTFGSLIHYALEQILTDVNIATEKEFEKEIIPNWFLTGTVDVIDFDNNIITDIKVTKTYAIENIKKDMNHPYVWQLNAYRYLAEHTFYKQFNMQIMAFNKQGGFDVRKGETIPDIEFIDIPKIEDDLIINKFTELVLFIKENKEQRCKDVFMRKIKGKSVPLKCLKYCSYNKLCKFYNPKPETKIVGWF